VDGLRSRFGKCQDAELANGVSLIGADHDDEGLGTSLGYANAERTVGVPRGTDATVLGRVGLASVPAVTPPAVTC
jgi:hypothetical protein